MLVAEGLQRICIVFSSWTTCNNDGLVRVQAGDMSLLKAALAKFKAPTNIPLKAFGKHPKDRRLQQMASDFSRSQRQLSQAAGSGVSSKVHVQSYLLLLLSCMHSCIKHGLAR
jgi:hypothetical protein